MKHNANSNSYQFKFKELSLDYELLCCVENTTADSHKLNDIRHTLCYRIWELAEETLDVRELRLLEDYIKGVNQVTAAKRAGNLTQGRIAQVYERIWRDLKPVCMSDPQVCALLQELQECQ